MKGKIILSVILSIFALATGTSAFLWYSGMLQKHELEEELKATDIKLEEHPLVVIGCLIDLTASHNEADQAINLCFNYVKKQIGCGKDPTANITLKVIPCGNFKLEAEIPVLVREFRMANISFPSWKDERRRILNVQVGAKKAYELLDEKCYLAEKVNSHAELLQINELQVQCKEKLKQHNQMVAKFKAEQLVLLDNAKAQFKEFCMEIENLFNNLKKLESQYPTISRYTYLRTALIRAHNEMQVEKAASRILYLYTDFVEDPPQKNFTWPQVSWNGITVVKFRIPPKRAVSSNIEADVLKWISDNGGTVKSELFF